MPLSSRRSMVGCPWLCASGYMVLQAALHFRQSETQATFDGCFARRPICSVISLDPSMSSTALLCLVFKGVDAVVGVWVQDLASMLQVWSHQCLVCTSFTVLSQHFAFLLRSPSTVRASQNNFEGRKSSFGMVMHQGTWLLDFFNGGRPCHWQRDGHKYFGASRQRVDNSFSDARKTGYQCQ